jgi:hypothetical protein
VVKEGMTIKLACKSAYRITFQIYGLAEREFILYAIADSLDELMLIINEHMESTTQGEDKDVKLIELLEWPGVYVKEG